MQSGKNIEITKARRISVLLLFHRHLNPANSDLKIHKPNG